MKRIIVAVPHSHTWLWTQICLTGLGRFPPKAEGFECKTILVDNSWEWSPSILGVVDTKLNEVASIVRNDAPLKLHGSALDSVLRWFECDYLMALETDVLALREGWLQWFVDQMAPDAYAVGALREDGDKWLSVSCTLYNASVLRTMDQPFAEKRGDEWWEPGKWITYQCRAKGIPEVICPSRLTGRHNALPLGTDYGPGQIVHLWAGSRASEPLRIPLEGDRFVIDNAEFLLRREARYWLDTVDADMRTHTLDMIRRCGFHKAPGERERKAAEFVRDCYRKEGLEL